MVIEYGSYYITPKNEALNSIVQEECSKIVPLNYEIEPYNVFYEFASWIHSFSEEWQIKREVCLLSRYDVKDIYSKLIEKKDEKSLLDKLIENSSSNFNGVKLLKILGERASYDENLFHEAFLKADEVSLEAFLRAGVSPNVEDGLGRTALHKVRRLLDSEKLFKQLQKGEEMNVLDILFSVKPDMQKRDNSKDTILHKFMYGRNQSYYSLILDRLKDLFIKQKVNVESSDIIGDKPIHAAVKVKDYLGLDFLLMLGASVNSVDHARKKTPLLLAAERQDCEMTRRLLLNGAKINTKEVKTLSKPIDLPESKKEKTYKWSPEKLFNYLFYCKDLH